MEKSKKLLYEALKIVNLQFDNNVNTLLDNKKKKVKIDLTNFKKELFKNNPQATVSNEALYKKARKLILEEIRQSVPRPPF